MSTTDTSTEFLSLQEAVAGRYSLEREIGRGGMGIVFLARDVALDRPVAIKLLPPALAADPEFRQRIVQEARTAASLSHPNIVPIHAVEEHGDVVFFVMTFVDGETLRGRVERKGPLKPSEAARLIQEVAWALTLAHAKGIVHRDIKPENILIDKATERAMVTDFGIAFVAAGNRTAGASEIVGTAHYMSPEQASGEDVDGRSDIYSLGVTAFFALTGTVPFDAPTLLAVLAKHVAETPPATASVRLGIPPRLGDAVDRCLAKDPTARFQSGEQLAEAVAALGLASQEVPPPVRLYLRILGDAAKLAFGVAFGAYFWIRSESLWDFALIPGAVTVYLVISAARGLLRSGMNYEDVRAALPVIQAFHEEEWLEAKTMVAPGRQRVVAARERAFRFLRDRPYRFFREPLGKLLFRVAGIGLRAKVRPAPPAIERTEVLLAAAAHSIYEALAMEYRSRLAEVPGVIRHLEAHAETLRKRRHELDRALPPARNENAQGHSELEAARAVDGRLATVVAALENLRLALLRLSTGQRSIDDLTADLERAREIGEEIDRLLEGQQEVADILESEETIPR